MRPRAIRHIDQARLADQETDADTPEGLKQAAEKNRETLKALKKSLEPETKDADADKENGEAKANLDDRKAPEILRTMQSSNVKDIIHSMTTHE